jgi:hypothetical protein
LVPPQAYDHVVGVHPAVHREWPSLARSYSAGVVFDVTSRFHEPLVLFGFLAAVTELELVTGVVILPQRQTDQASRGQHPGGLCPPQRPQGHIHT